MIDFFNNIYIGMAFGFCINVYMTMNIRSASTGFNNVFTVLVGAALILSPTALAVTVYRKWKQEPPIIVEIEDLKEGGQK